MYYYLIIAFQGFCIYHLLKNKNDYYWIFLIIFLPLIGCIIYLITQVYNKRDVDKIQDGLTSILLPSKKVKTLAEKLEFSDTYQNRVNLADGYFEMKDFDNAIKHYKIALQDKNQNNDYIVKQLIFCYSETGDYDKVVSHAETITGSFEFKSSKAQFLYGLALDKLGDFKKAEPILRHIDQRYSNYEERVQLAKLFIEKKQIEDAKAILNEISLESKHMTKPNKSKYRKTILEVDALLKSL